MAQMLAVVVVGLVATALQAQSPLARTSDTAIVVTGPLHYSSIAIPAGVTVKFVLPAILPIPFTPAVLKCEARVNTPSWSTMPRKLVPVRRRRWLP